MCFKKASGNLLEPWVSGWVALTWLMNFGGKYIRVDMIVAPVSKAQTPHN